MIVIPRPTILIAINLVIMLFIGWSCDKNPHDGSKEDNNGFLDSIILKDVLNKKQENTDFSEVNNEITHNSNKSNDILVFLKNEPYEVREFLKCLLSIYENCYIKSIIYVDSLIEHLCKFVPYSLSIYAAGEFPDGKESRIYSFSCWDSSDFLSDFILLPIDSKYCDTMTKRFSLSWDFDEGNEIAFKNMFSEDTLKKDGIGYVIVHIVNNLEFVGKRVIDIDYDITVRDTVDITLLYVNLIQRRGFMCIDSNIIIDTYEGFRSIGRVCYVKYPHACLWK